MWFLLFIIILIVLIIASSNKSSGTANNDPTYSQLQEAVRRRDQQWRDYITAYRERLSSDADKSLIDTLLDGSSYTSLTDKSASSSAQPASESSAQHTLQQDNGATTSAAAKTAPTQASTKPPIDNALLLLYLGAFLFVAAAGLFVAFAGFGGFTRTLIVAVVAALFYLGGIALFDSKPKLRQAGVSFTAIGMAIAPLIGLSYYGYVLDGTGGPLVWFVTSLGVMGLYLHALLKLRSTFVSYLLIFSFVSMLQSSMSILDAPTYFFVWMLVVTGLMLRLIARQASAWDIKELESSSRISAQVIIPVGIVVSLISVATLGAIQLAITLLLASFYYVVEGVEEANADSQLSLWQVAHALFIAGVAVAAYGVNESIHDAALSLVVLGFLHALYLLKPMQRFSQLTPLCSANALAATLIGVALAITEPWLLLGALGVSALLGLVLAFRHTELTGLFIAMIEFGILPVVYGGYVLDPAMDTNQLALFSLIGPLLVAGLRALLARRGNAEWLKHTAIIIILISLIPGLIALAASSAVVALFVFSALALLYIYLGINEQHSDWAIASGLFITGFVLYGWSEGTNPVLTLSMLIATAWNIALALHYGREVTRWIGSVLWFFLPIALLSPGWATRQFTSGDISWLYVVIIVGFLLARAIARGVLLRSTKKSMQTYESSASVSYVLGYYVAAVTGGLYGLGTDNAGLHMSLYLGLLIAFEYIRSLYIEKQASLAATIPMLLQLLLLSLLSPSVNDTTELNIYLAWSLFAAAAMFALPRVSPESSVVRADTWSTVAAATLFVAPFSVLFIQQTLIMMPIGLFVAGALMLLRNWQKSQDSRELTATILVGSVLWMMWYFDITNLQAYTHVLAAVFAGYAYWRYRIGDRVKSDSYLLTMFFMATIPLALQAIYGEAGDAYGWWLILEQIGFILLGMMIGRPFLIRWGLYVSVAAVLYQLRHLGWAALGFLAVFVIGLALYFLNRQDDSEK